MMTSVALAASYSVCSGERDGTVASHRRWLSRFFAPTFRLTLFLQLYPLVLIAHRLTSQSDHTVQPHQRVWSDIGQAVVLVPIGIVAFSFRQRGACFRLLDRAPVGRGLPFSARRLAVCVAMTFCVPPLATVVFWLAAGQPVAQTILNISQHRGSRVGLQRRGGAVGQA